MKKRSYITNPITALVASVLSSIIIETPFWHSQKTFQKE